MWAQQRGKMGGERGMSSGTQRELSELAGRRVEVDGNVEEIEGGCQKRVRQDGDKVLCAERAVVSAGMD